MKTHCLLSLLALAAPAHSQLVTHRWSFKETGSAANGRVLNDAIQGAPGVIRGAGAALDGNSLVLPGTSNGTGAPGTMAAYFDLPNGIISSKQNVTVEIWATVRSNPAWQRLFDFGRMNTSGTGEVIGTETTGPGGTSARDSFMLALCRGNDLSAQRFSARSAGGTEYLTDASVPISTNVQYHFVAVYQAGVGSFSSTGGRITWYRNAVPVGSTDVPFRLSVLQDVNNWLGRSQWSGDGNAAVTYNEFRLYDYAFSQAQVTSSGAAGPDAALPAPTAVADSRTMHRGQKVLVDVLANDSGEIVRSSLVVLQQPASGTATVKDGRILYHHTTGAPTADSFTYRIANTTGQTSTAAVQISFAETLRLANPHLNVPAAPPATSISLVDALPGVTFDQPLCLRTPPGETKRLFVCEKTGRLKVVPDVTSASPSSEVVLDLSGIVNTSSESGLLGLAFHPNFASNRYFYVFYSHSSGGLRQRVSRFTMDAANPNRVQPGSEFVLIDQIDDAGNHNGGDLHFGPDGYLYISVGDEGNANDTLNNSQTITKDFFSGILRIDVDKTSPLAPTAHPAIITDGGVARYSIPTDNPFVLPANGGSWNGTYNGSTITNTGAVRREFFATGLRNPWRFSFDPATGELWCGDVGQGAREEIDIIQKGGNYGWAFWEGNLNGPKAGSAPANFDSLYHTRPIYDYDRSTPNFSGNSVTGGIVYRGSRIASLTGKYIFADYGSGHIWSLQRNGTAAPTVERIAGEGGIVAFGTDPSNADVLLADIDGARVLRLVATPVLGSFPATLSDTGLFADLSDLSPAPGLLPYSVNLPFWSDHARKTRWFIVPDGSSKFGWAKETPWSLPAGTIWVKHFDMVMNRNAPAGEPPVLKRIETRLLVRNGAGVYGVSYRWNEAGTEAFLAADSGEDFTLNVTDAGAPAPQTWHIPSRAECLTCHTPQAGHALSFNTRQLNLQQDILGYPGNQLDILRQNDFFTGGGPPSPNLLPRHLRPDESQFSMEARVRSYLAVNCAYCHKAGGTAPANWDGRPELTLDQTGLINGTAANNGGDPLNKLVVPGSPDHSVVLLRVAGTGGFSRMPPLATNVVDPSAVSLLTQWIDGELATRQTYADWRLLRFGSSTSPEGSPDQDPDGDGVTNRAEFLAATAPLDGGAAPRPVVSINGQQATLGIMVPTNRSAVVEISSDLTQWTPWDIPGNQGLPTAGGFHEFTGPAAAAERFFRVLLKEN